MRDSHFYDQHLRARLYDDVRNKVVFAFFYSYVVDTDNSAFGNEGMVLNKLATPRLSLLDKFIARNRESIQFRYQFLGEQMEYRLGGPVTIGELKVGEMMSAYWSLLGNQLLTAANAYTLTGQPSWDIRDEEQCSISHPVASAIIDAHIAGARLLDVELDRFVLSKKRGNKRGFMSCLLPVKTQGCALTASCCIKIQIRPG